MVEQTTVNRSVEGSSPSRGANHVDRCKQVYYQKVYSARRLGFHLSNIGSEIANSKSLFFHQVQNLNTTHMP